MIIPGLNEPTFEEIKEKLKLIDSVTEHIQVDIADGEFIEHKTFTDIGFLNGIETKSYIELHLMVKNPSDFVSERIKHVHSAIAHIEVGQQETKKFIQACTKNHYQIGLALGPDTDLKLLDPYLDNIDFVQFVTVKLGKKGQAFNSDVLLKIKEFKRMHPDTTIKVDGGVSIHTLDSVLDAGAEDLIVVSAIFDSDNPKQKYKELVKAMTVTLNKTKHITSIAFLGGAGWKSEDKTYQDAYDVAKLLAENGYKVLNGGGPGVMRASTLGAQAGGGRVVAITYHPNKPKRHYESVDQENTFDEEIITLDYFDRTKVMLQTVDMHIVFNGSIGTMSELGMSWVSSWIHEPQNKPIVLYGDFWQHFIDYVKTNMLLKNGEEHILKICTTPQEVLEYITSLSE